jgi:hypothetical protein
VTITEPESKLVEPSALPSYTSAADLSPTNGEVNGEIEKTDTEVQAEEATVDVKEEEANEKPSPGKQREGSELVYC